MPGRLIAFILILLVIVTFVGFNIDNASDIRFWFGEKGVLADVPIFVSFFVMYLIGVLSVVPFMVKWKIKKSSKKGGSISRPLEGNETSQSKKKTRILGSKKRSEESSEDEASEDEED